VGVTSSLGVTELAHGYGFVAVFIAAATLRAADRDHDFHATMAEFSEQVERLLMVLVLLIFGTAVASGILTALRWSDIACAVAILLIIRPLIGWTALIGVPLPPAARGLIAFFGIRGGGTFYYMAYAMNRADFAESSRLWAISCLVVLISVLAHGTTSTPIMNWGDRRRRRRCRGDSNG
jgi:NhaP-type Na+/H+ or K+/H+ antiporter